MTSVLKISLVSSKGAPYTVELRLTEHDKRYWEKSATHMYKLFQSLERGIINQPYVDNPHLKIDIQGLTVYRPNHDTTHSLRSLQYVELLLTIIAEHGYDTRQKAVAGLTSEEKNLTLLAAFLFRSGRTDEETSSAGTAQNNRSAEIFRQVACALGYNPDLVNSVAYCIEHYIPVNNKDAQDNIPIAGFTGSNDAEKKEKVLLVNGLLLLSHNTDLVRCWPDVEAIHLNNRDNLDAFVPPDKLGSIEYLLLNFARAACMWTGTSFYLHEEKQGEIVQPPSIYKLQTSMELEGSWRRLNALALSWESAIKTLDVARINEVRDAAYALQLPQEHEAGKRLHSMLHASFAQIGLKNRVGHSPYSQSSESMIKIRRQLLQGIGLSPEEKSNLDDFGLTQQEHMLYDYLVKQFPWTLKHATPNLPEILASGQLFSSVSLKKQQGKETSHTNEKEPTREYVFSSIGSSDAPITYFLRGHQVDVIEIPLQAQPALMPNLISTSPGMSHREGRTLQFYINGNEINIDFLKPESDLSADAKKVYKVVRPDGQSFTYSLNYLDEMVTGKQIIPFHALQIIWLLRVMDPQTRAACLANPKEELLKKIIDSFNDAINCEILLPRQFSVYQHTINFNLNRNKQAIARTHIVEMEKALKDNEPASTLKALLDGGISPDLELSTGLTPLTLLMNTVPIDLEKARLLLDSGASITYRYQGYSLFSRAVAQGAHLLVFYMLQRRNQGDQVAVNADVSAIACACLNVDIDMLTLLKQHGLDFGGIGYELFSILATQPELRLLQIFSELEHSRFPFHKQTANNQEEAYKVLTELFYMGKYALLQKLIDKGMLAVAVNAPLFSADFMAQLQGCTALVLPELANPETKTEHEIHLYLLTADNRYLLVKSHHHYKPAPYWHGINGKIKGAINQESISGLCLSQIGWRPTGIDELTTIESQGQTVVIARLQAGIIPRVFNSASIAQGASQTSSDWKTEPVNDLSLAVLTNEGIPKALDRMVQLSSSTSTPQMSLTSRHVYHPNESILSRLVDNPHPDLTAIDALLKQGYSPNQVVVLQQKEYTLLMLALQRNQIALMQLLLSHGTDLNHRLGYHGITVLMHAIALGNLDAIKLLHQGGLDFQHSAHQSALVHACGSQCSDDMFDYLVQYCDVNYALEGTTPLMMAAMLKNDRWIKALLDKGANPDDVNPKTLNSAKSIYWDSPHWAKATEALDYKDYLNFLGHDKSPDEIDARVLFEYQSQLLTDYADTPFHDLEHALRKTLNLSENIDLALAQDAPQAIIPCLGRRQYTLALHRNFLTHSECQWEHVVFAVALENYMYETYRRENHFAWCTQTQYEQGIVATLKKLNYPPDIAIGYLRLSSHIEYSTSNFFFMKWPYLVYSDKYESIHSPKGNSFSKSGAIKSLERALLMQENSVIVAGATTKLAAQPSLMTGVRQAANALEPEEWFADYPTSNNKDELYQWFLNTLDSLNDELLPYEHTQDVSLSATRYAHLLSYYKEQGIFTTEEWDALLRAAFDKRIVYYDYIQSALNRNDPENSPMGYARDLNQAIQEFRLARTYENAQLSAEKLLALYHPLKAFQQSRKPQFKKGDIHQQGQNRYVESRLFHFIPDVKEPASEKLHVWAKQQYKECGHLGNIWHALWLSGLWDGSYCELITPEHQKIIIGLKKYRESSEAIDKMLVPFAGVLEQYQKNIMIWQSEHQPVHVTRALADEQSILDYIEDNKKEFSKTELSPTTKAIQAHLFTALDQVAKRDAAGLYFVKSLLLNAPESIELVHSAMLQDAFIVYVLQSDFFLMREKMNFIRKYHPFSELNWISLLYPQEQEQDKEVHLLRLLEVFHDYKPYLKTIFKHYHAAIQAYPLFSPKLVQQLDFIDQLPCNKIDVWIKKIQWQDFSENKLTIVQLTRLYRILDTHKGFTSWFAYTDFHHHILEQLQSLNDYKTQQACYINLLSTKEAHEKTRVMDEQLIREALVLMAQQSAKFYGQDDGTMAYQNRIMLFINDWKERLSQQDTVMFLDVFLTQIQAQSPLCKQAQPDNFSVSSDDILTLEHILNFIAEDENDKFVFLDFLSAEIGITPDNLDWHVNYIKNNPRLLKLVSKMKEREHSLETPEPPTDEQIAFWLQMMHQQFWSLPLAGRAIALDALILPLSKELSEIEKQATYKTNLQHILEQFFPDEDATSADSFARSVLITYLEQATNEERQFLLAGLVGAQKKTGRNSSLEEKIVALFEQRGPAYIKLGQAFHSNPDTPQALRDALAKLKSNAAPPYRWDLMDMMKHAIPQKKWEDIVHVGELLGSASYHIAVAVRFKNGKEKVVLLTRPDAAKQAAEGFAHIERTVDANNHSSMDTMRNTIQNMTAQAKAMSLNELDAKVGALQHLVARSMLYPKEKQVITYQKQTFPVYLKACRCFERGASYAILEKVNGTSFNQLPSDTSEQRALKKVAAIAVLTREMKLILSGKPFDSDRHGEQIKILVAKNGTLRIGLFDFGEVGTENITPKQRKAVCAFLAELPKALKTGKSLTGLIQQHIQDAADIEDRNLLIRTQKAFLALHDYVSALEPDISIADILKQALPEIHPDYQKTLKAGYWSSLSTREKVGFFADKIPLLPTTGPVFSSRRLS